MPSNRLILACLLALPTAVFAETVVRSDILVAGKSAGEQVATFEDDGGVRVHYEFNDRGRGPNIDATYRVASDGTLAQAQIKGVSYLKAPVEERFTLADGKATWRNASENGERALDTPTFYLALDGTPEEGAMLARALLKAPDNTLPLLPAGQARIERLDARQIDGDALTLYAIHGLNLTPELIWLDAEQRFYASLSEWFSFIRAGDGERAPALLAAQREIEQAAAQARAERVTQRLDAPVLIRNVRAFDPARGEIVGDSVLIDDGRIVDVGAGLKAPSGARTIDGDGRFLMPGLWDMHVHMGGTIDGLLHLASGVTTVRDMANDNDLLARRSADFEAGRDVGPRVLKAGFIDGGGPFAGPSKAIADDEQTVREWIDRYAAQGYQQIKLYSSLKKALVPGAIAYAHEKGLRVSGHVPVGMTAREFVELGADELQHANFLFLNFLAGPRDDTRTPVRFTLVAQKGPDLDLTGADVRDFIALLKTRGTVVDPTLVTFEDMFLAQPKLPAQTYAAVLDRLPATWQRQIAAGSGGLAAADGKAVMQHRAAYERMVALVGELHRSGVAIVAGTDAVAGLAYARELELYVQGGIAPAEVLRIATVNAARAMKLERERGSLAKGQVADLILVDGDPSRIVSDLRRVRTVIRGDRLFDADALAREAGLGDR